MHRKECVYKNIYTWVGVAMSDLKCLNSEELKKNYLNSFITTVSDFFLFFFGRLLHFCFAYQLETSNPRQESFVKREVGCGGVRYPKSPCGSLYEMSPSSELLLLEHVTGREMTCFLSNSCGAELSGKYKWANCGFLMPDPLQWVRVVLVCYSSELIKHFL